MYTGHLMQGQGAFGNGWWIDLTYFPDEQVRLINISNVQEVDVWGIDENILKMLFGVE